MNKMQRKLDKIKHFFMKRRDSATDLTARKREKLIKLGSEMTGGTSGAIAAVGAGAFIAGTGGAIAAAAINGIAPPLITEFSKRSLSNREKTRVGATIILARRIILERLERGDQLNESFFTDGNDGRPDALEAWEDILLSAQRENQEKKINHLASLMANMAFDRHYDSANANFLIKLCRDLSYRQLCLINIFLSPSIKTQLRKNDYRGQGSTVSIQLASVLHEIMEMHNYGIMGIPNDTLLGITDVAPYKMQVYGAGTELYKLAQLDNIPADDLNRIAKYLA